MSALEQFAPSPFDRRVAPRVRVTESVPVHLGRANGTLVDISMRGARVRHTSAVSRGTTVRVALRWQGKPFAACGTVLSSRVVALDGPTYESRVHFADMPDEAEAALREIVATMQNADLRRAVENLRGLSDGNARADETAPLERGFLRCRYFPSGTWARKWTPDPTQPEEGFTVPASISDFELAQLCRSYERIGADGRSLVRAIAETIIDSARTEGR
jgi:PilZ domain